ncbi:hypothetical protein EC957_011730 [Mortierella hygrophila]|uniref:3CxxC-type domain-containing protein n=1 Tax=Mortierella hygrophila TaxID=979708 RepID=A0A9P6F7E4_9FUNG|nr:hypothetical protein EC957_011730 [Mortierella hygrophila]
MPSSFFWLFTLVGTPILACSSMNKYTTIIYVVVVVVVELLRGRCSGCSDEYPPYEATPYQKSSYRTTPYQAPPYQASPYQASPYQASPYQASPYQASPYQKSPYQESLYRAPSPIKPKATSLTPVLGHSPVYTPSPPEYGDDYYTSYDDTRTRYEEHYSRYDDPTPTYNIPKPSPLPSSVYGYSPDLPTYCGQELHEHVGRHAMDRYLYYERLSDTPSSSSIIRDETRCVLGMFSCKSPRCPSLAKAHRGQRIWSSGSICVRVLVNSDDEYQTIIHSQQCNACDQFVKPDIDEDVCVKKIVGALDFWTGRSRREARNTNFVKTNPHDSKRCYSCQKGICPRREKNPTPSAGLWE